MISVYVTTRQLVMEAGTDTAISDPDQLRAQVRAETAGRWAEGGNESTGSPHLCATAQSLIRKGGHSGFFGVTGVGQAPPIDILRTMLKEKQPERIGWFLAARRSENPAARVCLIAAGGKGSNPLIHIPVGFAKMTTTPLQRHANRRGCCGTARQSMPRSSPVTIPAIMTPGSNRARRAGALPISSAVPCACRAMRCCQAIGTAPTGL